jgi:Flp pilus assembly protein TadG
MPRRWMAAGRRLWADPRGVEAVEAVALVGLFIALALAVLVVFNAQGGRLGGAAIA